MMRRAGLVLSWVLVASTPALGQTRPSESEIFADGQDAGVPSRSATPAARPHEDELFGGTPSTAPSGSAGRRPPKTPPALPGAEAEQDRLMAPSATNAFDSGRVRDNPLQIGGLFYVRTYANAYQGTPPSQTPVSFPTLLDIFLDARPTDWLRAMVLGRLSYDPLLQTTFQGIPSTAPALSNPSVALDQAWLSFDITHTVFVTVGRQHVRWGTGHFFSPDDFLASERRDPLAVFDARLGVSMVRAVVPWESAGWNFTAVALFEPTQLAYTPGVAGSSGSTGVGAFANAVSTPTSNTNMLSAIGGAARAEATFGNAVVGIDGLVQRDRKPRLGLDFSSPLGPLDVYAEGLLIEGSDYDTVARRATPDFAQPTLGQMFYTTFPNDPGYLTPSAVVGAGYTFAFQDNKSMTLGAEYFYNGAGYSHASIYPGLILNGLYQPFYTGKDYLAVDASLSDPTAKTTYTLSNIGNMTDGTYIVRFDFNVIALSYLTVEAFADYHYGNKGANFASRSTRLKFRASRSPRPSPSPSSNRPSSTSDWVCVWRCERLSYSSSRTLPWRACGTHAIIGPQVDEPSPG